MGKEEAINRNHPCGNPDFAFKETNLSQLLCFKEREALCKELKQNMRMMLHEV